MIGELGHLRGAPRLVRRGAREPRNEGGGEHGREESEDREGEGKGEPAHAPQG